MLRRNASEDELIVTAVSPTVFVHAAVVKADHPGLADPEGLVKWNGTLFHQSARTREAVIQGGQVRFDPYEHDWGTESLAGGSPLVYGRCSEGLNSPEGTYYEIAQPYIHHVDIHWRHERNAYCRFDHLGDWEDVVSITKTDSPTDGVTLVSFMRDPLDQYLVEHDSVVVQLFDFTLRRPETSANWGGSTFVHQGMDRGMVFYQQFAGNRSISAARGVQIVRPRLSRAEVEQRIHNWGRPDPGTNDPVQFTVLDFRNRRTAKVTTDPATTTNYFSTQGNSLPFDTSPAFFRPEVLSKYKADSEKYTVGENRIRCRGGWGLKSYSVNEAGQIAAYICDLRHLPHEEQLHWKIYNEDPRTGLSDRAITTDFLGHWPETMTPREMLVDFLQRCRRLDAKWWKWAPDGSPSDLVVVPRMENRDEWGKALVDLSNGVNEGFVMKELRKTLQAEGVEPDAGWRSIVLLEKILQSRGVLDEGSKLVGLRELNDGRRFSGVHVTGTQARGFARAALQNHGTYTAHFEHLCQALVEDLKLVEREL